MRALKQIDLNNVVFIDIETVRSVNKLEKDTDLYHSWEYKVRYSRESDVLGSDTIEDSFHKKAALYAEFGKIVCITIGKIKEEKLMLKSYYGEEHQLLSDFGSALNSISANNSKTVLCGHAIIGFDIPFLMRRCLINQIELPTLLDVGHLKPWEVTALDTMVLWKASGFYGASLLNISTAFGLPSPKMDINGSETSDVYYNEGDKGLQRIVEYCERDVVTVANVVLKCRYEKTVVAESQPMTFEKTPVLNKIYNNKAATESDKKVIADAVAKLTPEEMDKVNDILAVAMPKAASPTKRSVNGSTKKK